MKTAPRKWDGDAHLANQVFGEDYGVNWWYAAEGCSAIVVPQGEKVRIIEVGELLECQS